jgi:glucose-1-phosphate cytidylyltransferase
MKCVILAGGLGTRLAEETKTKPKPMVKIGTQPIIWHIMKIYRYYGVKNFLICSGYKDKILKDYFKKNLNKIKNEKYPRYYDKKNDFFVTCVNTGLKTNTAGRILKIKNLLKKEKKFFLTYGDGVSNINIKKTLEKFNEKKYYALVCAVKPPARYGVLKFNKNLVVNKFQEKIDNKNIWINGGFFIFSNQIFKHIKKYSSSLEYETLPSLIKKRKLLAYNHTGFWACMDTLRDKIHLNNIWNSNNAPWKIWL